MNLKPCGYYILIEIPAKQDKAESSSIIIPKEFEDAEISASDIGIVRGIGPGAFSGVAAADGMVGVKGAEKWGFTLGDKVEFTRYDGKRPSIEGYENYRFIQDQHIIAKVEV